jgi:hypothetical protein
MTRQTANKAVEATGCRRLASAVRSQKIERADIRW